LTFLIHLSNGNISRDKNVQICKSQLSGIFNKLL
jgi:hypothetical protein